MPVDVAVSLLLAYPLTGHLASAMSVSDSGNRRWRSRAAATH